MIVFKGLIIFAPKCVQYLPKRYIKMRAIQLDPSLRTSPWIGVNTDTSGKRYLIDECFTVPQLFFKVTKTYHKRRAFGCRLVLDEDDDHIIDGRVLSRFRLSAYKWFNWREIDDKVDHISKGFLFIGIKPKDIVMILAETRLEWLLSCQALMRLGSTVATLDTTSSSDAIVHAINETQVTHLITNYNQLSQLNSILDDMPSVKCIVYMDGPNEPNLKKLFTEEQRQRVSFHSLSEIEKTGKSHKDLKCVDPNFEDTAFIVYTSGSTGIPKGVNISHKNLLTAIKSFSFLSEILDEDDVYCSYLPLSHIFELAAHLYFISNGVAVGFGSVHTLTDRSKGLMKTTKGDLTLLKPTVITSVPVLLNNIRYAIEKNVDQNVFTKVLFNLFYYMKEFFTKHGYSAPITSYLFCTQFKPLLGGRVKVIAIGGAPLSPQTEHFIRNCLDVKTIQGYGLTETCASATATDLDDTSVGTVGAPLDGIQIKLVDWSEGNYRVTDSPNPRGELVIGGDNVAKGYFKNDKLTEEYFKEENGVKWFSTGDIGEIYPNGNIKIIDRKKDIIKLPKGEYIALAKVEDAIKKCPFVDNVCVYGHSLHDYLVAFISPNPKALYELAKNLGKSEMSFEELCNDYKIYKLVFDAIKREAKHAKLNKREIPTKIKLCSDDWSPESGLVTTSLKIRRKYIQQRYQNDINILYAIRDDLS